MVKKRVPDWLNSSLWSPTPSDDRLLRFTAAATTDDSAVRPPVLEPPPPPVSRPEPASPPARAESRDPLSNDGKGNGNGNEDRNGEDTGPSAEDISRQPQLLTELSKKVINVRELRRIASQGIPDGAGIRSTVWNLLLGYLPPDRTQWSSELAKKRSQYKHFKDDLLMNPSEIARKLEKSMGFENDESKFENGGMLSRSEITHGEHPLSLGKTSVWNQFFQVPGNSKSEPSKPSLTPEEMKQRAQQLRERACKKKEEEEKRMEREREKERVRIGKELLEAKRIEEENERKRLLALRKAEKEERKAREKNRLKLEEDKAERRRRLGLPPEEPAAVKPAPVVEEKKSSLPVRPATKAELMRECLRSLKQTHKDDDARVKRAFQTLLTYIGNIARNPDAEKFRKNRLTNQTFQDRVGSTKGGVEFLELCGFEKIEGGEFIFIPRDKVDMAVLNSAGSELNSAINNPFFGVL